MNRDELLEKARRADEEAQDARRNGDWEAFEYWSERAERLERAAERIRCW